MAHVLEDALIGRQITGVAMHRDGDGSICGLRLDDGSYLALLGEYGTVSKVWPHLDPEGGAPTGAEA